MPYIGVYFPWVLPRYFILFYSFVLRKETSIEARALELHIWQHKLCFNLTMPMNQIIIDHIDFAYILSIDNAILGQHN